MGRNRAAIALLGVLALGSTFYAAFRTKTATLTWDYDYENNLPCSGDPAKVAVQKSCVIGFNIFLGTSASRTDQRFVPNRFDQNGQIISKRISWTMPVRSYGEIQFCVVSVATLGNDQTIESQPLCSTQRVLPFGLSRKSGK